MGQYYRATLITTDKKTIDDTAEGVCLSSYHYDNGSKLMEHSYVGNFYVDAVCSLILGERNAKRILWCGDYTEVDDAVRSHISTKSFRKVMLKIWGDEKHPENDYPEIKMREGDFRRPSWGEDWYFVNLDQKLYVKVPKRGDLTISPLPILTATSNGKGGGDYEGTDMEYVGAWAGDTIFLTDDVMELEGCEELEIHFTERDY